MIVTDRFVFLHIPKTGGTFVRQVVERLDRNGLVTRLHRFPDYFIDEPHVTMEMLPRQFDALPKLVCVRNPYDHYVSHYEYRWWAAYPQMFFNEPDFLDWHPRYLEWTFPEFMRRWHDPRTNLFLKLVPEAVRELDVGFLTREWSRFLSRDSAAFIRDGLAGRMDLRAHLRERGVHLMRQETLNADLIEALVAIGFDPEDVAFIGDTGHIRPHDPFQRDRNADWRRYYDEVTLDMVRRRDRLLFQIMPEYAAETA